MTIGSPAAPASRNQGIPSSGVQAPPSQPGMSSNMRNEGGLIGKSEEAEYDEASRLDGAQRDADVAWHGREGVMAQRDQDSEWYSIENDRQATFDAKLREPVRRSETKSEFTAEDFFREAQRIMQAIQGGDFQEISEASEDDGKIQEGAVRRENLNGNANRGVDSSTIASQNAINTDSHFPHLPLPGESLAIPNELKLLRRLDAFDSIPGGISGGEDFLPSLEVHSGHRLDSYNTNTIARGKPPATLEPNIDTSITSMCEHDVASLKKGKLQEATQLATQIDEEARRRVEEEEEAAAAAWLAAKPSSKNIYTNAPAVLDDTSSIQSYNDRIFDDLESVLSSVPSLGDNAQAVFVSAFVDLLIRDPGVDRMIARATSDGGVGVEHFRRSFSRILKAYSRDLRDTISRQPQKEHNYQRVAAFISRETTQASSLIATRYKERAPKPNNDALDKVSQYLDGLESEHCDSSDEEGTGTLPTVVGLETFLLQGKPFKALKWQLRSLVISNQRVAQVKTSAEHLLNFLFCDLGLEETFARAQERVPDFSTWLHCKIDLLVAGLETEMKAKSPMAEYLRTYSDYISAHAVQKLGHKVNVSSTQYSKSRPSQERQKVCNTEIRPPEEILEDIMVDMLPEVFGGELSEPTAWARLSSTKSFRGFTSDLTDAAYPTFFSESRKALKAEIDSEVTRLSAESEERYLLSILMELQCLARNDRKSSLSIESSDRVSWLDRLKLFIEKSSGSEWSWWPLSPPPRAGSSTNFQLVPLDMRSRAEKPANFKVKPLNMLSGAESPANVQFWSSKMRRQLSRAGIWSFITGFSFSLSLQAMHFSNVWSQDDIRSSNYWPHPRALFTVALGFFICAEISLVLLVKEIYTAVFYSRNVLSPTSIRRHEEHKDCAKVISWQCTCGCTRRELVSPKYANLFLRLASKYPMTYFNNSPAQSNGLCVPRTPSPNSPGGASSSANTQSIDSSDSTGGGSTRASVSTAPSSTGSTTITLEFDRQNFVHLLVRKGDRFVLSPMKVTDGDARGFFRDLIVRYQRQRGFLRRFLSIFVYSHCDFVKVKNHRAHRFSPIPGFSFPEPGKDIEYHEYTYNPQPMIQVPITKHMFNDYFYSCYDSQNMKHAFLHKFRSSCDVIETLPQDLLESMPKRDREVTVGARFGRVEHFWGIVAREQRSALRVILYMLLSLMPTVWFMFMWMFSWGHDGDLQTATVPVTISLATLSMVWIVVYSGGESENE